MADKTPDLPKTEEDLFKAITVNRMMLVDEVVNTMFNKMGSQLYFQGFPIDDKEFFQDYVLVGEMLRALLYNSVDVDHPLYQALLDNRDKLKDLTEKGDLVIMEDDENGLFDEEF
jgi:hypothetical protein|tara:strand:+ start:995 stop:1339 length:345 start_codon:yes stop_codon:yes gene_type:complete